MSLFSNAFLILFVVPLLNTGFIRNNVFSVAFIISVKHWLNGLRRSCASLLSIISTSISTSVTTFDDDDDDDDDDGNDDDDDDDDDDDEDDDDDADDVDSCFVVISADSNVSVSGKNEYSMLLLLSMNMKVTFSKKSLHLSLWYRDFKEWGDKQGTDKVGTDRLGTEFSEEVETFVLPTSVNTVENDEEECEDVTGSDDDAAEVCDGGTDDDGKDVVWWLHFLYWGCVDSI